MLKLWLDFCLPYIPFLTKNKFVCFRTIELMTERERSVSKESANAPLSEVAPDGPKPNVSSQPPPAPNPLPGAGLPPAMLAALPPGLNPAAMAAMAASGLPFPVPPFNMAMPPFFNPGALNEMAKLYGNPMLNPAAAPVSVAGAPPGMGGIVPPGVAAGLTGPRFIQPPGPNKPQPEAHGGMNGGGMDVGVGFSHPISGNMGMQVPVLNSASSADEDYDDLSADDYFDVSPLYCKNLRTLKCWHAFIVFMTKEETRL